MYLQDGNYGSIDIIGFGIRSIVDIHWEPSAWDIDDGCFVEKLWKFLGL